MGKLISIVDYVIYPSYIFMALYVLMIVMWLFATDFYDHFEEAFEGGGGFFTTMFILCGCNYLITVIWSALNPINYLVNFIIAVLMLVLVLMIICSLATHFNQYCKTKRGKS